MVFFFFFQAEDGIRDLTVTGVQTCALPICGEAKERGDSCQCNGGELDHLLLFPQSEHPLRRCGLIGRGMRVISFEHDEVTQPARLELIGGGVEDAAIGELVPAVPPAHASVEQAQASPLTCPAELRLKRRRHPSAASVVGAAVLEANPPSQRQDGSLLMAAPGSAMACDLPPHGVHTREVEVLSSLQW